MIYITPFLSPCIPAKRLALLLCLFDFETRSLGRMGQLLSGTFFSAGVSNHIIYHLLFFLNHVSDHGFKKMSVNKQVVKHSCTPRHTDGKYSHREVKITVTDYHC